jgi:hypothetical protein
VDAGHLEALGQSGGATGGTLGGTGLSFEFIGQAAVAGIDPLSFVKAEDDVELEYLIQAARAAIERHAIVMKQHAALTIFYLGKSFGAKT